MEIFTIILLLILIVMNICMFYIHFISYERKKVVLDTEKKPKLTKEEKDKQKKIKESFENLMNYDESVARKIRK